MPGTPVAGPIVDVNNDGIADLVFSPPQGGSYFGTALGRGDGTFSILDQTTPLPLPGVGLPLMTGDFNGDGKVDTIAIQPGTYAGFEDPCDAAERMPNFSPTWEAATVDFKRWERPFLWESAHAVAGSPAISTPMESSISFFLMAKLCQALGLLFVPGNGDGTFGTPVPLSATQNNQYPGLLVGDLNNDGKLDFIWGDAVFLGNGDGTFKQIPLTIPASFCRRGREPPLSQISMGTVFWTPCPVRVPPFYAGNGDGTFQTTPFFTVPLSQNTFEAICSQRLT